MLPCAGQCGVSAEAAAQGHSGPWAVEGLPPQAEVLDVACGWSHTLVLLRPAASERTQVWGWGRNTFGQLGGDRCGAVILLPPAPPPLIGWMDISLTSRISVCFVLCSQDAVLRPRCVVSELPNGVEPTQIRCGSESSHVLGADGSMWALGWNEHGNLGVGDQVDRRTPTRVDGPGWHPALLACGGAHVLLAPCGERLAPTGD
jgi:alpha-tubulin suppressor-like RCC1 family protein